MYSGPIAASGYASVAHLAGTVRRVVLLGPAHRVYVEGLAVPSVDAFLTPFGPVAIDTDARELALGCRDVVVDDHAHASEHSLEVHLPFLQHVLGPDVRVLPIAVGRASASTIDAVLAAVWGGPETLIVVSSDLSHYEPYDVAATTRPPYRGSHRDGCRRRDRRRGRLRRVPGARPAPPRPKREELEVELLDLRNSGDTAGSRDRVVGYGAFALTAPTTEAR